MAGKPAHVQLIDHSLGKRPFQPDISSQSYLVGSTTMLFIAVAQLSPGTDALTRLQQAGIASAFPYGSSNSFQ